MISLVMATYNGEKFLIEQLDSIRDQILTPDEVIICDDKSKDGTVELVKNYILENKLYNWKLCINEINKGYSRNFTDAINMAKGEYIFLADQDDIWHEDKIQTMFSIISQNHDIQLLASNVHPFYEGNNPQTVNYEKFKGELIKVKSKAKWIKPARPGCSMCFRKELLKDYYPLWDENYPHDCLLWGLAVLKGTAYIYNHDTIEFRRHDSNASSRGGQNKDYRIAGIVNEIRIMEKMYEFSKFDLIENQIKLYKKRISALKNGNCIQALLLVRYVNFYPRIRYWLTDVFYAFKGMRNNL